VVMIGDGVGVDAGVYQMLLVGFTDVSCQKLNYSWIILEIVGNCLARPDWCCLSLYGLDSSFFKTSLLYVHL
jgi:hypothetical protein